MRDNRVRAPMLSVGSARANSSRQQAGESRISLIPTSADSNAAPGPMPNSTIAYPTSTMHDG
jgi:hypothetical protein